jgi:hypothetical protein
MKTIDQIRHQIDNSNPVRDGVLIMIIMAVGVSSLLESAVATVTTQMQRFGKSE